MILRRKDKDSESLRPTIFRLAVYVVVCLIGAAVIVAKVGVIDWFHDRGSYKAILPEASGLSKNDSVKISGVGVGKVTGIHLQHGHALVTFTVDSDVKIRSNTRVGMRWRNLLGQRFLYLWPSDDGKLLKPGDTLPMSQAVDVPDVGKLLNDLGGLLQRIDPKKANQLIQAMDQTLTGNEGNIDQLFTNAGNISESVGGLDHQIGSLLDNLSQLTGAVSEKNTQINATLRNVQALAHKFNENDDTIDTLIDQFSELLPRLESILDRNGGDFDAIVNNLKTLTDAVAAHQGDLEKSLNSFAPGAAELYLWTSTGQYLAPELDSACVGVITARSGLCTLQANLTTPPGSSPPGSSARSASMSADPKLGDTYAFASTAGSGS